jgi:hypothetical protein
MNSDEYLNTVSDQNELANSSSEHSEPNKKKTKKKRIAWKKQKEFGLPEAEITRLQVPISGEDLVKLGLEKNSEYANVLADRLNLLQIRMNAFEERFKIEAEEDNTHSYDYWIKNPHQIASYKYRLLSESVRIQIISMIESNYRDKSNYGRILSYYTIALPIRIGKIAISPLGYEVRHLLPYESAVLCRLLWPVFDYAYPNLCRFMIMIPTSSSEKISDRDFELKYPAIVEAPTNSSRAYIFKSNLYEMKMYNQL